MFKQPAVLGFYAVLLSCGLIVGQVTAQPLLPRSNTAASVNEDPESEEPCSFTSYILYEAGGKNGYLVVKAKIADGHHIYSLTQPDASATKIEVAKNKDFEIAGVFRPTKAPQVDGDPQSPKRHEIHFKEVEFYLPIKLAADVVPEDVVINVRVNGQVCSDSNCVPISNKVLTARYGALVSSQDKRYQGQNTSPSSDASPIRVK
jgi:Disulphide bond corrector protein DsbC